MNPIDSYVHSHSRHWLSATSKKNHYKKPSPIVTLQKKPSHNVHFNSQVIDTFCFHWPDMHSYVLVRVLDKTIAILPVRSRVAFLYFHHAPMPNHPSPKGLRKASLQPASAKKIQDIFKGWKHTLALDENMLEQDEGDSQPSTPVSTNSTESHTMNSSPKAYSGVTLSDVLSYEPNLNEGWIHAPCTVKDDINIYDNTVILTTKHTELHLVSRCFTEKMMFMNLVKLKHTNQTQLKHDNSTTNNNYKTSNDIIECLQATTDCQIDSINLLKLKLSIAKEEITNYTKQLLDLQQSVETLLENTSNNIQYNSLRTALDFVNHQLDESRVTVYSYMERVSQLKESVSGHIAFLAGARQRFEQIKSKVFKSAIYPYTSFVGVILIALFAIGYYYYHYNYSHL